MGVLRTPDVRFTGLPGYPFEPHYVQVETDGVAPVRMHYVDEGPRDGRVVLLLHGQPTWSYLYRKVIAPLVDAGLRAIAPDNIGFGRSDKLTEATDYTFQRHVDWMHSFVTGLDLQESVVVVQDWGGPIGLSVLAREPDRFAGVVAANTILHTGDAALAGKLSWALNGVGDSRVLVEEALLDYVLFYQRAPEIRPSMFVDAVAGPLPADVLAAYDAPFPDPTYKAGLRQLTALIPLTRNDPGAAIGRTTMAALETWSRPFLTAFSDGDFATRGWESVFQERVRGARGQKHVTIKGAGHFLQEQKGEELGRLITEFAGSLGPPRFRT
ncbi:MAG TPA: haloalkane dehalogenase [Acidimicrobiales bacterium]